MRGCGWDAHRVFDIAVPLFPVGRGRHTVVRHQPDGMVDGVPATAHREERDGYIEYTVRIPTAAAQR